jgi:hypothetical protein
VKVSVDVVSPEVLRIALHASAVPGGVPSDVASQILTLGSDVVVPVEGAPALSGDAAATTAAFDVRLRTVPEPVLTLDAHRMELRWEGLDADGTVSLAIVGTPDFGDPGDTELPLRKLYDAYGRLNDLEVVPGLSSVRVRGSLGLLNPFGFDLVVDRIAATVRVGGQPVLSVERPGFRLHAGQRSAVPIDQEVALADAAGATVALLRGDPPSVDGVVVIRTAQGEREVPLHLGAVPGR